jgi:hypothetical protein
VLLNCGAGGSVSVEEGERDEMGTESKGDCGMCVIAK